MVRNAMKKASPVTLAGLFRQRRGGEMVGPVAGPKPC
jgi:hypothetical protein